MKFVLTVCIGTRVVSGRFLWAVHFSSRLTTCLNPTMASPAENPYGLYANHPDYETTTITDNTGVMVILHPKKGQDELPDLEVRKYRKTSGFCQHSMSVPDSRKCWDNVFLYAPQNGCEKHTFSKEALRQPDIREYLEGVWTERANAEAQEAEKIDIDEARELGDIVSDESAEMRGLVAEIREHEALIAQKREQYKKLQEERRLRPKKNILEQIESVKEKYTGKREDNTRRKTWAVRSLGVLKKIAAECEAVETPTVTSKTRE